MKYTLSKSIENSENHPLIFEKFSEETDFAGKMEQIKSYFENQNEVSHDNYNVAKKRLKGLLNRNENNTEP